MPTQKGPSVLCAIIAAWTALKNSNENNESHYLKPRGCAVLYDIYYGVINLYIFDGMGHEGKQSTASFLS
jgi:hypothetical protein